MKNIDCFIIGFNEIDFHQYEEFVRRDGIDSGAYRHISLSFINYMGRKLNTADAFGFFSNNVFKPLNQKDNFSLAIAYLGSYLKKNNLTFDYINSFQDEKTYLENKLRNDNVLTVAITTTFYMSSIPIQEIISFIRKYNKKVKIIVGGPYILNQLKTYDSNTFNAIFQSIGADLYINSSQGEKSLVSLISNLKKGQSISTVPNLFYKDKDNYISTEVIPENNQLENNPINWSLFKDRITVNLAIRSSISCPFSCAFCSYPSSAGKYQFLSIKSIRNELDQIQAMKKTNRVFFIDDTFNVPVDRFKDVLRIIIDRKYTFKWYSYLRCQYVDDEMAFLLKQSNCIGVFLGIESGSNAILKNMNKKASAEEYLKGISILKKYDILTYASFIIGFPGETIETVKETQLFIAKSEVDFYRAYIWYCDTKTPIYKQKDLYNISGSGFKWSHSTLDSKTAYELRKDLYKQITKSVCMPDIRFDLDDIFHLLDLGIPLYNVKKFLQAFNDAVLEKEDNNPLSEISSHAFDNIRYSLNFLVGEKIKDLRNEGKSKVQSTLFNDDFAF